MTKLPAGLNQTYDRIWARIVGESSSKSERKWALKTLKLVLHVKRPLDQIEILAASAIDPSNIMSEPPAASSIDYLIQVCGNFIALDAGPTILRFVHYSEQEYLSRKQEFHCAEAEFADLCFIVLGQAPGYRGEFYKYASAFWDKHAQSWLDINPWRGSLIESFLLNDRCFRAWQASHSRDSPYESIAYMNLPVLLRYRLEHSSRCDGNVNEASKSLAVCTRLGRIAGVKVCLDAGADVNYRDSPHASILTMAVKS